MTPLPPLAKSALYAALVLGASLLKAETFPFLLPPVVTTATRVPELVTKVGSAEDVVSGSDLASEQLFTLAYALGQVPASPAFGTGRTGASNSLFLRGANSDQVVFLVDGIRMNDANTDYGPFLGGARVFSGDSVEVLRGPQSTLYGSGAAGGVVSLASKKGVGSFSGDVSVDAGSFGTLEGEANIRAGTGDWGYSVSVAGTKTDNDRINNEFKSDSLALRLDRVMGTYLSLGVTLRGFQSHYGDPGDEFTNNPSDYEKESNWLGTVFADVQLTQYIKSHLILGGQDRRNVSYSTDFGDISTATVKNTRVLFDWQNTLELTPNNSLVAGLTAEADSTHDNGFGNIHRKDGVFSYYAEDQATIVGSLFLTGGIRRDEAYSYKGATTERATLAWLGADSLVKFRGSYGTAFNAPSFLDLYGKATGYVGNRMLNPETSDGWDMGIDFYGKGTTGTFSLTWFQTDYRQLIVDNFFVNPATTENVGVARTRGIEFSYKTIIAGAIQTKLSYTRLEADDVTDGTALLRRPRYSANAELFENVSNRIAVGVGASWVGVRADVDAQTFDTVYDPSYAVARVFASWKFNASLSVTGRIENALGKDYSPVNGYPALGRGYYGGVVWKF